MDAHELFRICSSNADLADSLTIDVGQAGGAGAGAVRFIPELLEAAPEGPGGPGVTSGYTEVRFRGAAGAPDARAATLDTMAVASLRMTFAIPYLLSIAKARTLSARVTLHLAPGVPLIAVYDLGPTGTVRFFLAPRV